MSKAEILLQNIMKLKSEIIGLEFNVVRQEQELEDKHRRLEDMQVEYAQLITEEDRLAN